MTLDRSQARDELSKMVTDVWPGNTDYLIYDDLPGSKPDTTEMWGRLTIKHIDGQQANLGGSTPSRRYSRTGILTVQIFTPSGKGLSSADDHAKIISGAFEGTQSPSGIWFRNVTAQEIGPDGDFYQTNVTLTFMYDEIK